MNIMKRFEMDIVLKNEYEQKIASLCEKVADLMIDFSDEYNFYDFQDGMDCYENGVVDYRNEVIAEFSDMEISAVTSKLFDWVMDWKEELDADDDCEKDEVDKLNEIIFMVVTIDITKSKLKDLKNKRDIRTIHEVAKAIYESIDLNNPQSTEGFEISAAPLYDDEDPNSDCYPWIGIKQIPRYFDSIGVDLICNEYGGCCLSSCGIWENEDDDIAISDIEKMILDTLACSGDTYDSKTKLVIGH